MENFKILICDDHTLFRKGLISLINGLPDIEEIKEASGHKELFEIIPIWLPDLLILDLEMPEMDGVEISEMILSDFSSIKILILTMHDNDELIGHLFSTGIHGYVAKDAEPEEICKAIETLRYDDLYYNSRIVKIMRNLLLSKSTDELPIEPKQLNQREIDVLRLVCWENTTNQIAEKLSISTRTVEKIRSTLIKKTGSVNTIGLIKYAYANKLIVF